MSEQVWWNEAGGKLGVALIMLPLPGVQVEYEAVHPGEPELGWWLAGQVFFCALVSISCVVEHGCQKEG